MRSIVGWMLVIPVLVVTGATSAARIEAYAVPTSAEIAVGADSGGKSAPRLPGAEMKALVIVAPRNGVANGQILLKAAGGPATTRVTVLDFTGPGGATIPAAAVQVRYGQYITSGKNLSVYRWQKDIGMSAEAANDQAAAYNLKQGYWRVDCLLPTGQCELEEGLPRCAWLTFHIARDAAPGRYSGAATAAGAETAIPIELEVVDAVVPDPAASAMSNDIRPTWEVIALGNGIPLEDCWKTDRFWKVTEAYLAALGRLRVSRCGVGVMAPSTSSSLGMVKWVKNGDAWSWDYAAMDKFIATYRRAVGEPRVVEATAFSHDEQRCGLSILYTDAVTGKQAMLVMGDDQAAGDLAAAFVKDLTAHLAVLKLDGKLAVGIWHDKMQHTGGKIRQRLLKEFPDLKLSLWAHSDGWGKPVQGRVGFYMAKCHMGGPGGPRIMEDAKAIPYPIKSGMRPAWERPVAFGPFAWDAIARGFAGLGQVDFANWSADRRAKEYTYYGAGMFTSYQRQLVYPMQDGQVVTGVLYELFREYAQDYDLLKLMQAQGVKTGFLADPRAAIQTLGDWDKAGGRLGVGRATPAKVDATHHDILRQAGQAKVRPEGK